MLGQISLTIVDGVNSAETMAMHLLYEVATSQGLDAGRILGVMCRGATLSTMAGLRWGMVADYDAAGARDPLVPVRFVGRITNHRLMIPCVRRRHRFHSKPSRSGPLGT